MMRLKGYWLTKSNKPLFSLQESARVLETESLSADAGMGRHHDLVRDDLRTAAHKIGKQMQRQHDITQQRGEHVSMLDMKLTQQYIHAKVDRKTFLSMKQRVNESGVLGGAS